MKSCLKLFNYSGNKNKYVSIINDKITKLRGNSTTFCEPFVGSGSVFFNSPDDFDEYIINDKCRNVYNILNTFKNIEYDFYKHTVDRVFDMFGTVKCDAKYTNTEQGSVCKTNYYNFRNWFNENYYMTDSYEEGIFCSMLANMCINSFLRFSKNGMNQSWGNRYYEINETDFKSIKHKLQNATIYNVDGIELIKELKSTHSTSIIYFLDPPYFSQASSYEHFSEDAFNSFLSAIENETFVYTDILNQQNQFIKNKEKIRTMLNTSPMSKNKVTKNEEYIFWS